MLSKLWRTDPALDAHVRKAELSRRILAHRVEVLQRGVTDRVAAPSTLVGGFFAGATFAWLTTCSRRAQDVPAGSFWQRARLRIQREVGSPFWPALMFGARILVGVLEKYRSRRNLVSEPLNRE